ncbi:MAG: transposase [Planctomycetota bacterium]
MEVDDLVERGLQADRKLLFALDESRALSKTVKRMFGKGAEIQRCHFHKGGKAISYLPEHRHTAVRGRLPNAWRLESYKEAKRALQLVVRYLGGARESAARSFEEGLDEALTLHRLSVPESPRRTLWRTNAIEDIFSNVRSR